MVNELNKLKKLSRDVSRARFQVLASMNNFFRDFKLEVCLNDLTPEEMSHSNAVMDSLEGENTTNLYLVYNENIMAGERGHGAVKFVENKKLSVMINWRNLSVHLKFAQGLTVPSVSLDRFEQKTASLFLFLED